MLNLNETEEECYEIKLYNGIVLKLERPTQKTLMKIDSFIEEEDNCNKKENIVRHLYGLLKIIFNNNRNGLTFDNNFIEKLSINFIKYTIKSYRKFVGMELEKIVMPTNYIEKEYMKKQKPYLYASTDDLKTVSDYTSYNFNECIELDCVLYKKYLKDAYIKIDKIC